MVEGFKKISAYLDAARQPQRWVRAKAHEQPPSADELVELIAYLEVAGCKPVLIGSLAVLLHLNLAADQAEHDFRPTKDADVWVCRVTNPPAGWTLDRESVGVVSWFSPSGGRVDLMLANQHYPSGDRAPAVLEANRFDGVPVAKLIALIKLKLSTWREKDLFDIIHLLRHLNETPTDAELGRLTPLQTQNWALVKQWLALRPQGQYGE